MWLLEGNVGAEWFAKDHRKELICCPSIKEISQHDNAMKLPQNSSTDPV
jgi:hypothetical protein